MSEVGRNDFELVLQECISSVLPGLYDDEQEVVKHTTVQAEEYLEAWTDPTRQPITDKPKGRMQLIRHPMSNEFDEQDAHDMASISTLGRLILESAKKHLRNNPELPALTAEEAPLEIMNFLSYGQWYYHQKNIVHRERVNGTVDSHSAHPNRLKNWPYGEKINCLGAAIGAAAMCEIAELPYRFCNELRTADHIINERHQQLMQTVDSIYPGILTDPQFKAAFYRFFDATIGDDDNQAYRELLFNNRLKPQSGERVRDFHHFVLLRDGDNWLQVDPYAMTMGWIHGAAKAHDHTLKGLTRTDNDSAVALYEATDQQTLLFSYFERFMPALKQYSARLGAYIDDPKHYKSAKFIGALSEEICAFGVVLSEVHSQTIDNTAIVDSTRTDNFRNGLTGATLETLMQLGGELPESAAQATYLKAYFSDDSSIKTTETEAHKRLDAMEAVIMQRLQQDGDFRQAFRTAIIRVPVMYVMVNYLDLLMRTAHPLIGGAPNTAFEAAHPDFMIGAMTMNHYATHRKDGKINIARHLARLSASQLLWQAAQQENCEEDPRITAMTELINQLAPKQLHPFVLLARHVVALQPTSN